MVSQKNDPAHPDFVATTAPLQQRVIAKEIFGELTLMLVKRYVPNILSGQRQFADAISAGAAAVVKSTRDVELHLSNGRFSFTSMGCKKHFTLSRVSCLPNS